MRWTHVEGSDIHHETFNHSRARVYKVNDFDGWTAMIWDKDLSNGKYIGMFKTSRLAKAACEEALPEHLK